MDTIVEHQVCVCSFLICISCITKLPTLECGQCKQSDSIIAFIKKHKIKVKGQKREKQEESDAGVAEDDDDINNHDDDFNDGVTDDDNESFLTVDSPTTTPPRRRRSSRIKPAAVADEERKEDADVEERKETDSVRALDEQYEEQLLPSIAATVIDTSPPPTVIIPPSPASSKKAPATPSKKSVSEIHQMLARCEEKNKDKSIDQLFSELKIVIQDSSSTMEKSEADKMDMPAVIAEATHIHGLIRKSREVMMRLRVRLGALYKRIYLLFVEGTYDIGDEKEYFDNAGDYIKKMFNTNEMDIRFCKKFYEACCVFPALIWTEENWTWIKTSFKDDLLTKEIVVYQKNKKNSKPPAEIVFEESEEEAKEEPKEEKKKKAKKSKKKDAK